MPAELAQAMSAAGPGDSSKWLKIWLEGNGSWAGGTSYIEELHEEEDESGRKRHWKTLDQLEELYNSKTVALAVATSLEKNRWPHPRPP